MPLQCSWPAFPAAFTQRIPSVRALATIASGVPAAPVPSPREVLYQPTEWLTIVIPCGFRVGRGGRKIDLRVDADRVQLCARRHLVHDLRHRGAVLLGRAQRAAAVVDGRQPGRQLAGCLTARKSCEAEIDDRDLRSCSGRTGRVPGIGLDGRDPLALDAERERRVGRAYLLDTAGAWRQP